MGRGENRSSHKSAVAHGKAPRSLQASERLYRSLFENMIDGCAHCRMLYDKQGRPEDFVYLYVNPAFERLSGLAEAEHLPFGFMLRRLETGVRTALADGPRLAFVSIASGHCSSNCLAPTQALEDASQARCGARCGRPVLPTRV
jgi:PAS domain-containing protein